MGAHTIDIGQALGLLEDIGQAFSEKFVFKIVMALRFLATFSTSAQSMVRLRLCKIRLLTVPDEPLDKLQKIKLYGIFFPNGGNARRLQP